MTAQATPLGAHLVHELAEYEDLLVRLEALHGQKGPRETMVELGAGVWANASVPDTEVVTVEIGLGICVDMPLLEAANFTRTKIASLQKRLGMINEQATRLA